MKGSLVSEKTITHPAAFEVDVDVDVVRSPNGTSRDLIVASNVRVDRFLAWAGTVDDDGQTLKELFWTSEDDSLAVQQHPGENRFLVAIPPSVTATCLGTPTCEIVIQAVKYWTREGELQHATEIRKSITI